MKPTSGEGRTIWKDLILELRTKEVLSSVFVFTLLVVIFNLAFQGEKADIKRKERP